MKHLKTFEQLNEELNPETYKSVIRKGEQRSDLRGKRLAGTARGLLNKNHPGYSSMNLYNSETGDLLGTFELGEVEMATEYEIRINGEFDGHKELLTISTGDQRIQKSGYYDYHITLTRSGTTVLLDRKGVNTIYNYLQKLYENNFVQLRLEKGKFPTI